MKKIKLIVTAAFLLAITSAFTSRVAKTIYNPTAWGGQNCDLSGPTNENGCSTVPATMDCSITVTGVGLVSPVFLSKADCGTETHILQYTP